MAGELEELTMRRITILAVAMLGVVGCKGPKITFDPICFDGCGGGSYDGHLITTTVIGFPTSRVDTVGPLTVGGFYYGRLEVGDSVTLYVVRHELAKDPCASPDTLRSLSWSTYDPAILQARADSNGRGVVRALTTGESTISATAPDGGGTATIWTCNGPRSGHYVGMIRVDPKSP